MFWLLLDALLAGVCMLPLLLLLRKSLYRDRNTFLLHLLFALYLAALLLAVGFPWVGRLTFDPTLNLVPFRATDVNDLLTNTAGTLLGWLLVRGATRGFTRGPLGPGGEKAVAATCAVAVLTMFLVQPVVSGWLWDLFYFG